MLPAKGMTAFIASIVASAPAPLFAQQIGFDVPEQAAVSGIPEFARQARIQIISPAGVAGQKTKTVKGSFTVEAGLRRLLRGTDFYVARRIGSTVSLALRPTTPEVREVRRPKPPTRKRSLPPADVASETDIIVTGTVNPQRRLDSGLAITTVSLERIHEVAPNNTADLLKLVPGIWAETTGGATGANVFVRGFPTNGDAPYLTVQLDGAPIYPPTELSFNENTTLFRVDDMVEKVEVLRGGTGPIFSNGQPGAIMNFIQRTGTPDLSGGLRATVTDYGTRRIDAYLTGPLALATEFAVGGFYRKSDGLRDTQFPADRGGQITGNVTHRFSDGQVMAYVRYTRDRNAFYTGVPLLADGRGGFAALRGFDPLTATLIGRNTQNLSIENGPGLFTPIALDQGRGLRLLLAGASVDWSPASRFKVTNRFNITSGDVDTASLFTGPVPETLQDYITDTVARANADPRIVGNAGLAYSGHAVIAGSDMPVSPSRYVLTAGLWSIRQRIDAVTDELRASGVLGGHTVAGGVFLSHYHSNDQRQLGNNLLLLAEPNAQRIDLVLDNGVKATRDGFTSATTGQVFDTNQSTNVAAYLNDDWLIRPRISVNAGIRLEHQALSGNVRNVATDVDFDSNPLTLYDNNGVLLLPSSYRLQKHSDRLSLSVGFIYKPILKVLTLHLRFNHGSNLPSFDKLRLAGPLNQSADIAEFGGDVDAGPVQVSLNTFINHFTGLQFSRLLAQPDGTINTISLMGGADAKGLELETKLKPDIHWSVALRGTYEDSRYRGFGVNTGNRVVRQPKLQFAASPSYTTRIDRSEIKFHATVSYVGARYSDVENAQRLPPYMLLDAGLHAELPGSWYGDVVAQNVLNSFGLTEGNTRVLGSALSSGPVIARPLFRRNVSLSIGYRF